MMTHSTSYDQHLKLRDIYKNSHKKNVNNTLSMGPKFIPEKDKWERKISGYLDTSTSTGATLTAINFGLKRVTETDKYLVITKSPTSRPDEFLEDGISHIEDSNEIYQSLLRHSTCYDVMPDSGKMIIINSQMEIERAFDAIEDNVVRASPIWCSDKQCFIALLTVNDVVPLLLHLHQIQFGEDHCCDETADLHDNDTVTVESCLRIIPRFRSLQNHIIQVTPEMNLRTVNSIFSKFHRPMLLVIDSFLSGNPLFLLTGLRILSYLFYKAHSITTESCFSMPISSSSILLEHHLQTLKPLVNHESPCDSLTNQNERQFQYVIYRSSSFDDVLRAMATSFYCCALVVDKEISEGKYVITDVITMSDILHLIKLQRHKDLTLTADNIIQLQRQYSSSMTYRDPVISCAMNESIAHLIHVIVREMASFVLVQSIGETGAATISLLSAHDVLNYIDNLPYRTVEIHNHVHGPCHTQSHQGRHNGLTDFHWSNRCDPTILDEFLEDNLEVKPT